MLKPRLFRIKGKIAGYLAENIVKILFMKNESHFEPSQAILFSFSYVAPFRFQNIIQQTIFCKYLNYNKKADLSFSAHQNQYPMDYEKRLTTLKELLLNLSKKVQHEISGNNSQLNESKLYMQQIESEIQRIIKMRSYKK